MGTGMTSTLLRVAVGVARFWTRLYTLGMPADIRDARLTEIESDLWECQHDPGRPANAPEMLTRLLLGVPHDLLWRIERAADGSAHSVVASTRRSVTVSAFTCSLALHLVALAGTTWWASWPSANTPSQVRASRAQAVEGPALIASSTLAVSESARPAQLALSEREPKMTKAALAAEIRGRHAHDRSVDAHHRSSIGLRIAAQTAAGDPAFEAATVRAEQSGSCGLEIGASARRPADRDKRARCRADPVRVRLACFSGMSADQIGSTPIASTSPPRPKATRRWIRNVRCCEGC